MYRFDGVTHGPHYLFAEWGECGVFFLWDPEVFTADTAQDLTLPPPVALSGRVIGPAGKGLEGANVRFGHDLNCGVMPRLAPVQVTAGSGGVFVEPRPEEDPAIGPGAFGFLTPKGGLLRGPRPGPDGVGRLLLPKGRLEPFFIGGNAVVISLPAFEVPAGDGPNGSLRRLPGSRSAFVSTQQRRRPAD